VRRLTFILLALALGGCGSDETDRLRAQVEQRIERTQKRAQKLRDRITTRVKQVLEDLEKAVPEAPQGSTGPRASGTGGTEIEAYMVQVIEDVDRYWTRTLRASDLPEPRVSYVWVGRGDRLMTGCRIVADDGAAFYCPADDTIYVAQRLAAEFYRAVGDFGVAYVIAHEYAHNVQQELGRLSANGRTSTKPFELQADCMAGLWGNSVYAEGRIDRSDVEEAIRTAYAVGDFDYGNPNHHGTPDERRDAWLTGFRSGDPRDCTRFAGV
jgi:predicted metalloprotease